MPVEDLSKVIARTINDVQQLQAEDAGDINRNFVDPIDQLGVDDDINALVSNVNDTAIVDFMRLDHKYENARSVNPGLDYTINSNVLGYWPLNETTGSVFVDQSSYNTPLIDYSGTTTAESGLIGVARARYVVQSGINSTNAFFVPGASATRLNCAGSTNSIDLFLKCNNYPLVNIPDYGYSFILNNWDAGGNGYALVWSRLGADNHLSFWINIMDIAIDTTGLNLNQWYHVGVNIEKTDSTHTRVKIYKDGVLTANTTVAQVISNVSNNFNVFNQCDLHSYQFNGAIQNLRLTNTLLNFDNVAREEITSRLNLLNSAFYVNGSQAGSAVYYTPWQPYCGSWQNFTWTGSAQAGSIFVNIQDASGTTWASGTSNTLSISGIESKRQIRAEFVLNSSTVDSCPYVKNYTFTYDGNPLRDNGTAFV